LVQLLSHCLGWAEIEAPVLLSGIDEQPDFAVRVRSSEVDGCKTSLVGLVFITRL
jgi:hypothetical protein